MLADRWRHTRRAGGGDGRSSTRPAVTSGRWWEARTSSARTPEAKFDLATQGQRQSGSSFKPFVLAAALDKGVPLERVYDAPGSLSVPLPERTAGLGGGELRGLGRAGPPT